MNRSRVAFLRGMLDTLSHDLRFAIRTLLRAPAFSVVAVLSLALGAGAATALFSLVNTITLKPLSYREPGQLVFIREVVPPLAHIYPTMPVNRIAQAVGAGRWLGRSSSSRSSRWHGRC